MDRRISRILLEQPAENAGGSFGFVHVHESGTPCEQEARIIRRVFQKGTQDFNYTLIPFQYGVAESKELADKGVIWIRFELPLKRRNSLCIQLCAEAGQSPIAIKTCEAGLPR